MENDKKRKEHIREIEEKVEEVVAPTAEMQLGQDEVLQIAKDADLGGRTTEGAIGKLLLAVGLAWTVFQLWYASPLPFALRLWVFNDTEARAIHLAFGLFLAFLAFPALKRSPRDRVPVLDWLLALVGAFCGAYLFLFYNEVATRPGNPSQMDLVVGIAGVLILLEATRRAVGLPMTILAILFIATSSAARSARRDRAQGRIGAAHDFAHVAGDRRRVRHRARRFGQLHLCVRAVRHAARPRRRRQLYDAGELCAAGPSARRPGQGRGRFIRTEWPDLRLVGQQRRLRRDLHDPADEARRLRRSESCRDRDLVVGQRPDHAAGDGRGSVPDGRIRRHPVFGNHQARVLAGDDQLHRALLHRSPGSAEARHEADRGGARAHTDGRARLLGHGSRRHDTGHGRHLLRRRGGEVDVRRSGAVGARAGYCWRFTSTASASPRASPTCRTRSTSSIRCCRRPGRQSRPGCTS